MAGRPTPLTVPVVNPTDQPRWNPLRGTLTYANWTVDIWSEPRLPGETSQDPLTVRPLANTLRLGVADPAATNPDLTGLDVAWSGLIACAALALPIGPDAAFEHAARHINRPGPHPRLANPIAQLAAADIDLTTGTVTALRAGDCEVWVRRHGAWEPLLAGPRLTAAARTAFAAHPGAHRSAGEQLHYQAHLDVLEDPEAWITTPLGMDVPPRTQQATTTGVEEVIVSSDGARLNAERCANLSTWLTRGLQQAPENHPHPSPHGDVTVLHARTLKD